jgi:hypothetical protein
LLDRAGSFARLGIEGPALVVYVDMVALAMVLVPVAHGWAVRLTDGRELARFSGLFARRRALRFATAR